MSILTRRAFTLIELLIVVAIIAILAAIAVPNFLEAQVRSKVARTQNDLRTLATGLEAYRVDWSRPPPTPYALTPGAPNPFRIMTNRVTTPVAYLTGALYDTFADGLTPDFHYFNTVGGYTRYLPWTASPTDTEAFDPKAGQRYYYISHNSPVRHSGYTAAAQAASRAVEGEWTVASYGPDPQRRRILIPVAGADVHLPYDPSNGTISAGNIWRSQKISDGKIPN